VVPLSDGARMSRPVFKWLKSLGDCGFETSTPVHGEGLRRVVVSLAADLAALERDAYSRGFGRVAEGGRVGPRGSDFLSLGAGTAMYSNRPMLATKTRLPERASV
jgi:hypothetical protein